MPFDVEASVRLDRAANAWSRPGQLADGVEYVDYEFQAVRGRRYSVHVYSTAEDFHPTIDVGQLGSGAHATLVPNVAEGEHAADATEFVADSAGVYVLRVGATDASSGSFNIVVSEVR